MLSRISAIVQSVTSVDRRRFLLFVMIAAHVLRLGFVLAAGDRNDPRKLNEYGYIAANLAGGAGYSMHWWYATADSTRHEIQQRLPEFEGAFMPPMNVYLVYLAFLGFGVNSPGAALALMLLYATVGAITPVVLYHLTRRISGEGAARLAAIALAIFPPAIFAVTTFSGSVLFQTGALLVMMFAIDAARDPTFRRFAWLGVACGLMAFLRSEFFMLGLLIIATAMLCGLLRNRRAGLVPGIAGALVMLSVVAPWTWRNYTIFERVMPVISHPWGEIWRGNNDYAEASSFDADGDQNWFLKPHYRPVIARLDSLPYDARFEVAADSIFRDEVMSFIERRPARAVSLALQRVALLWSVDLNHPMARNPFYIAMIVPTLLLLAFGFALAVGESRRRGDWSVVVLYALFFLFTSAIVATTHVQPRHQIYLVIVAFPFVGLSLARILPGTGRAAQSSEPVLATGMDRTGSIGKETA